jgi:hypothetical protein
MLLGNNTVRVIFINIHFEAKQQTTSEKQSNDESAKAKA